MSLAAGYIEQLQRIDAEVSNLRDYLRKEQSAADKAVHAIHREIEKSSGDMIEGYRLYKKLQEALNRRRVLKDEAIKINAIEGHLSRSMEELNKEYQQRADMGADIFRNLNVTLNIQNVVNLGGLDNA